MALFPIAWFFGFLYYTEVPSLLLVVLTFIAASDDNHWLAASVRLAVRHAIKLGMNIL